VLIPSAEATLPPAPEPQFEELVVDRDVVLGLQMDTTVSSEDARVEDQVIAHVTRDVRVGDRIAIPSGTKAYGEVTLAERGGRLRERARLGVRFSSLILSDGSRVPISTDVVFRAGDSPSRESAAKIGGGALGGAIIGGILGGGKGAVLGGSAGAGAGTAVVMTGGRNAAVLRAGTPVTVRLTSPVEITTNR
jgi:type IV secretory pathway VirB10-like protein